MLKNAKCLLLALGMLSQAQVGFSQTVQVNNAWIDGEYNSSTTYYICREQDASASLPSYTVNSGATQVFRAIVPDGHDITQWSKGTSFGPSELNAGHLTEIVASTSDRISITGTSALKLYLACHFDWLKYGISFAPNGGTGTMTAMSDQVYNVKTNLSANAFTRRGYTFSGWSWAGGRLAAGAQVDGSTFGFTYTNKAVSLSANWTANVYTLTFNANGGEVGTSSKSVTYDSTYGTLPVPTRLGYAFAGWYTADAGGNPITAQSKVSTASNHTLYAHWTANAYEVTFNANGGKVEPTSQNKTYDATYGEMPKPTRTGYSFSGWYTAAEGGTVVEAATKVTTASAHTLYAHWTANKYTVTFNANGGTVEPTSQSKTYDATYGEMPKPTRTGYSFSGWYTAASGGTAVVATTKVTTASAHTLYAHWTANKYTVTFDANGGAVSPASRQVEYGATYGTLPDPVWAGHKFDGWYTAKVSGEPVYASTKLMAAENQTIYAHWTIIKLRVQLSRDESGDGTGSVSGADEYDYGTSATIQATPSEGSEFVKWSDGDTAATRTIVVTNAVNLSALFRLKSYTVTFVYFNASGREVRESQSVKYGKAAKEPARAVVDAYPKHVFEKWDDSTFGTVKGNLTVTAVYIELEYYKIVFNGNKATSGTMETLECQRGVKKALPTNLFSRTGYAFMGWANSIENASLLKTAFADGAVVQDLAGKDMTCNLYATWSTNAYTVSFFPNGGVGEMVAQDFVYDQPQSLLKNEFSCEGASFAGWVTDTDASLPRVMYGDEAVVTNLTASANGHVRLYATWSKASVNPSDLEIAADCYEDRADRVALSLKTNNVGWSVATYGQDGVPGSAPKGENNQCVKVSFAGKGMRELKVAQSGKGILSFQYHYTKQPDAPQSYYEFKVVESGQERSITKKYESTSSWVQYEFAKTNELEETFCWVINKQYEEDPDVLYLDNIRWNPDVRESSSIGLTYRLNDGSAAPDDIYTNVTRKAGSKIGSWPTPPAPKGLTFEGWATSPDGVTKVTADWVIPSADTQLYAVWSGEREPDPPTSGYLIYYYRGASDAKGEMANTLCEKGKVYSLAPCAYSRLGYRFVGWACNGRLYDNGMLVFNLSTEDGAVLKFTALWEAQP